MAGDLTLNVDLGGVKTLLAALDPSQLRDAVSTGLRAIATRVQGVSREVYLSGPRPTYLDRRSGTLARSIIVDEADLPASIAVGSALVYAAVHEFGATIRATGPRMVFGLGPNGGAPFRSAREVTIPARPFLAPALRDIEPSMGELMSDAIIDHLESVG